MEAALRTAWEIVTETPLPVQNLHVAPIQGLEGVKVATVTIEGAKGDWAFLDGATVKIAVASGLGNAQKVIDKIKAARRSYHFVEVMTCPGGCIGGGGQPRFTHRRGAHEAPRGDLPARTSTASCASPTRTPSCASCTRSISERRAARSRTTSCTPTTSSTTASETRHQEDGGWARGRRAREAAPGDRGRLRGRRRSQAEQPLY